MAKGEYEVSILAKNLIRLRKDLGLTQAGIAATLGIERSRYAHYEKDTTPSADTLRKIAAIFRVTMDELLYSPEQIKELHQEGPDYIDAFYFNELRKDEKSLIMKYRLLSKDSKKSLHETAEQLLQKEEDL